MSAEVIDGRRLAAAGVEGTSRRSRPEYGNDFRRLADVCDAGQDVLHRDPLTLIRPDQHVAWRGERWHAADNHGPPLAG